MADIKIIAAARKAGQAALLGAAAAAAVIGFAGAAHAAPDTVPNVTMYGNPTEAAQRWRHQHLEDCGPMSAADVVGQMTGKEPSETAIWGVAVTMRSTASFRPALVRHGHRAGGLAQAAGALTALKATITDTTTQGQTGLATGLDALEQHLAQGHAVIAGVNAETIWGVSGDTDERRPRASW